MAVVWRAFERTRAASSAPAPFLPPSLPPMQPPLGRMGGIDWGRTAQTVAWWWGGRPHLWVEETLTPFLGEAKPSPGQALARLGPFCKVGSLESQNYTKKGRRIV